jgi:hypothetical protein
MAVISKSDLLKRNNISVFVERVNNGGSFKIKDEKSKLHACNGKVIIKIGNSIIKYDGKNKLTDAALRLFVNSTSQATLQIELDKKLYKLSDLYKDKDFGGVAGKSTGLGSERQELGLIAALNAAAFKNSKAFVSSLGKNIHIKSAYKNEGLSPAGQEPYIDIFIETQAGKKYGISNKGESAPSLAGGGLVGLNITVPDLMKRLYSTIDKYLKTTLKLKENSVISADFIPDIFIRIPDEYVKKILIGNKQMGGPVDYMYIGKMDVTSTLEKTGELKINGEFFSISQYMKKIPNFFFRIRKRDIDNSNNIKITYSKKNKEGYPLLFVNPNNNKPNLRIVIVDKISSTGKELKLI